ncbi:hamartin isoform X2 [Ischnura elegans]|uniref:hamartin isoform X2 n=1 Tax=Ischnura elegans TaxID=197161 RepID=UPI001ED88229|nr:hamartin isoform X2 [Ischnura elegans]
MDVPELFNLLESNQPQVVEDIKKKFHEHFNATKESWLLNGIFDYYMSTNSYRMVEILVGVREPHDKYLFDRLSEGLKGSQKQQSLTLLGHIVRRQPTWLYKIAQHTLMKDLLKLLKTEVDILPLMSALLVIIVLLPMIPALIGPYLQDIFDVFSRLAAWNTNNPNKLPEEHLLHLQLGLYALFHRLYGMYPCNFLSYLRVEYGVRENLGIFSHTIKPMIDTVRMHPQLVTASKDAETATSRWKKMEHHDVIVECGKLTLDYMEKSREEIPLQSLTSFRSRSNLEYSTGPDSPHQQLKSNQLMSSSSLYSQLLSDSDFWSPSVTYGVVTPPPADSTTTSIHSTTASIHSTTTSIPQTPNSLNYGIMSPLHHEGTSPPEAAVEATPETTPIKDVRPTTVRPLMNSGVARALNSIGKWPQPPSGGGTPSHSQPSSPMKKELSPFRFPDGAAGGSGGNNNALTMVDRRDSLFSQKMLKVRLEQIEASSVGLQGSSQSSAPPLQHGTSSVVGGVDGSSSVSSVPGEGKSVSAPFSPEGQQQLISTKLAQPVPVPFSSQPVKSQRQSPPHVLPLESTALQKSELVSPVSKDPSGSLNAAVAGSHVSPDEGGMAKRKEGMERNGLQNDSGAIPEINASQEDQVLEIVKEGDQLSIDTNVFGKESLHARHYDSVLREFHHHAPPSQKLHASEHEVFGLEDEECQLNAGSPCSAGGLHMPNSASMMDFARRVSQIHYGSHCGELFSLPPSGIGSRRESREVQSDEDVMGLSVPVVECPSRVKRANSCPDFEKGPTAILGEVAATALKEEEEGEDGKDSAQEKGSGGEGGLNASDGKASASDVISWAAAEHGGEKDISRSSTVDAASSVGGDAGVGGGEHKAKGTQTVEVNYFPHPYEHLFMGLFPQVVQSEMDGDSRGMIDTPSSVQTIKHFHHPYALLDKYMETLANSLLQEEREVQKIKHLAIENENRILKEQLMLWHIRFQFERLCRDVHGERNRRLFGKSRTNRALEEHNNALRDQLSLLQKDLENVYNERENYRKEFKEKESQLQKVIDYEHQKCHSLQNENKLLRVKNEELEQDLKQERESKEAVIKELQNVESSLFAVRVELRQVLEKASAGEQLRGELEHLQKEMVLMGELQQRYRDSFSQQALQKRGTEELSMILDTLNEESKNMHQLMDSKTASLNAAKSRVTELEGIVTRRDMLIADQKRLLKCAKEEYQEQLEAVENKYNALRAINQKLEEQLLELHHQVSRSEKGLHGPDGGSLCGSVGASGERPGSSSRGGFSPHGSPLLDSLGPDCLPTFECGPEDIEGVRETEQSGEEEGAGASSRAKGGVVEVGKGCAEEDGAFGGVHKSAGSLEVEEPIDGEG